MTELLSSNFRCIREKSQYAIQCHASGLGWKDELLKQRFPFSSLVLSHS